MKVVWRNGKASTKYSMWMDISSHQDSAFEMSFASKTDFDINKFGYNIVVKMNVNVQN